MVAILVLDHVHPGYRMAADCFVDITPNFVQPVEQSAVDVPPVLEHEFHVKPPAVARCAGIVFGFRGSPPLAPWLLSRLEAYCNSRLRVSTNCTPNET